MTLFVTLAVFSSAKSLATEHQALATRTFSYRSNLNVIHKGSWPFCLRTEFVTANRKFLGGGS